MKDNLKAFCIVYVILAIVTILIFSFIEVPIVGFLVECFAWFVLVAFVILWMYLFFHGFC